MFAVLLRPTEVYNLRAEYNEDSNIINVTWTDSSNFPDEELGYQITYSIAARNVTLLNANDTIYNASVNQTSALFEYQITENVLPGVTVTITVQPCNRFGFGPPRTTSETVPGGMYVNFVFKDLVAKQHPSNMHVYYIPVHKLYHIYSIHSTCMYVLSMCKSTRFLFCIYMYMYKQSKLQIFTIII